MSTLKGGIFSKPRGKTGGIVFGAARTRSGKLVTARELVPPSNPKTPLQVKQRTKFSDSLKITRRIGAGIYQKDWNRSVGQLPGFQSMESVYLNQIDDSFDLNLVNPINLGLLHYPDTVDATSPTSGSYNFAYSNELGSNGTALDNVKILMVAKTASNRILTNGIVVDESKTRDDSVADGGGLISGETYEVYFYVEGQGTAAGLISTAKPLEFTVS